jgi:hypothetical protein
MRPRFPDPFPKWNIRAQNGKFCPRSTTTVSANKTISLPVRGRSGAREDKRGMCWLGHNSLMKSVHEDRQYQEENVPARQGNVVRMELGSARSPSLLS